jgi:transketolase
MKKNKEQKELKSTRDGFGEGLVEIGDREKDVVVLTADLEESTRVLAFKEKFPERFFEVGVAEQALVTIASGMANYGKIPFATSFSVFSPGRNWEQIRTTIALNDVPVKIVGTHAGFSASADGATHQALEDIAMMRVLPNMVVFSPCDALEAKKAVLAIAKNNKPTYLRLFREATSILTKEEDGFEIGKITLMRDSVTNSKSKILNSKQIPNIKYQIPNSVAIISCGPILAGVLNAAKKLEKLGIACIVLNCHTIKPIDEQAVIHAAKIAGAIVTVEEHQVAGGLGSAVSEVLARNFPVPIEFVGVKDVFGESGTYKQLLKKHSLTSEGIVAAVKKAVRRKNE